MRFMPGSWAGRCRHQLVEPCGGAHDIFIPAAALTSQIIVGTMAVAIGSIVMDVWRMASLPVDVLRHHS